MGCAIQWPLDARIAKNFDIKESTLILCAFFDKMQRGAGMREYEMSKCKGSILTDNFL